MSTQPDLRIRYLAAAGLAVTGATGYIGRHLLSELGTAAVAASLDELPEDTVLVHLAAAIGPATAASLITNLSMDLSLLQCAAESRLKLVYASTNNVYPKAVACDVSAPFEIGDYYSAAKVFGEQLVRAAPLAGWCVLRIGDVFGPGQRHGGLFQAIEASIRSRIPLRLFGRGLKVRNYIYIDELSALITHVVQLLRNGVDNRRIFNVCFAEHPSVHDILSRLALLTGLPVENVSITNDSSHLDIRTMVQTPIPRYTYRLDMEQALAAYVAAIMNSHPR